MIPSLVLVTIRILTGSCSQIRMELRLDKDMKAVAPPPFKYFMTGITDPLNATFTGTHPIPNALQCSNRIAQVPPSLTGMHCVVSRS